MQRTTPSHQQFCLRHKNYQSNFAIAFDHLLQNETFVDVTLVCDGTSYKAHKIVLSACSALLQTLLVENPCPHPIIIMNPDMKSSDLQAIVEFMYKGKTNVSQEQIGPLLKVAETLKIQGLADAIGEQEIVAPATTSDGVSELTANTSNSRASLSSPAVSASTDNMPDPLPSVKMMSSLGAAATGPGGSETAGDAPSSTSGGGGTATPLPSGIGGGNLEGVTIAEPLQLKVEPGIAEMIPEEERDRGQESRKAPRKGGRPRRGEQEQKNPVKSLIRTRGRAEQEKLQEEEEDQRRKNFERAVRRVGPIRIKWVVNRQRDKKAMVSPPASTQEEVSLLESPNKRQSNARKSVGFPPAILERALGESPPQAEGNSIENVTQQKSASHSSEDKRTLVILLSRCHPMVDTRNNHGGHVESDDMDRNQDGNNQDENHEEDVRMTRSRAKNQSHEATAKGKSKMNKTSTTVAPLTSKSQNKAAVINSRKEQKDVSLRGINAISDDQVQDDAENQARSRDICQDTSYSETLHRHENSSFMDHENDDDDNDHEDSSALTKAGENSRRRMVDSGGDDGDVGRARDGSISLRLGGGHDFPRTDPVFLMDTKNPTTRKNARKTLVNRKKMAATATVASTNKRSSNTATAASIKKWRKSQKFGRKSLQLRRQLAGISSDESSKGEDKGTTPQQGGSPDVQTADVPPGPCLFDATDEGQKRLEQSDRSQSPLVAGNTAQNQSLVASPSPLNESPCKQSKKNATRTIINLEPDLERTSHEAMVSASASTLKKVSLLLTPNKRQRNDQKSVGLPRPIFKRALEEENNETVSSTPKRPRSRPSMFIELSPIGSGSSNSNGGHVESDCMDRNQDGNNQDENHEEDVRMTRSRTKNKSCKATAKGKSKMNKTSTTVAPLRKVATKRQ